MDPAFAGAMVGVLMAGLGHPLDTMKTWVQTSHREAWSLRGLYRGVSYPMTCSVLLNAWMFSAHDYLYQEWGNHALAGGATGLLSTLLVNPLEVAKIRRQEGMPWSWRLQTGWRWTGGREGLGTAFYFWGYHALRDRGFSEFTAGGLCGVGSWWLTYPIDVIKTRVQIGIPWREACRQDAIFKGIGWCTGRALLVNSLGFTLYEHLREEAREE